MKWIHMGKQQKIKRLIMLFFSIFPINNKKIVIRNYYGKGFGDSGKYISLELLKKDSELKIIWLTSDVGSLPNNIIAVKDESLKALFALSTSRVWIDNCRKSVYTYKRKNQLYIQTWHGPIGFKLCEKDSEQSLGYEYIQNCIHDSSIANYMTSGSRWNTELIRRAFWYSGDILEIGTPRNDVFFRNNTDLVFEIKNKLNSENKKAILYAPTFRASGATNIYNLDFAFIKKTFEQYYGCKCVIWIRLHPNISEESIQLDFEDVLNVTDYPDMQNLLIACDVLLTDFSSSAFDALLMKKPVFLIAKDYESFIQNERKMYFDVNNLPFPFGIDELTLAKNILRFDKEKYQKEIEVLWRQLGVFENGKASESVAETILEYINKNAQSQVLCN